MAQVDPYRVLGVHRDATKAKIRKAYKMHAQAVRRVFCQCFYRLVQQHPDKNPKDIDGANRRMQDINAAYEILNDPIRRYKYDLV